MRLAALAWRYLWSRPLASLLNLALLSLGLAAMSFVMLCSEQLEAGLRRDLAGIDLVVGAKGSPMQIMLAGVFHLDVPTGNIPLQTLTQLRAQPLVARAIPLALGDSLRGYRIVGTEPDYLAQYQAELAQGALWQQPLQAVLGAEVARRTGLRVGDRFAGSHGLGSEGEAHAQRPYQVVGVLKATGSVLDRLVLTDLASVWALHGHEGDAEEANAVDEREITMLLLSYRSPLAAVSLPRWVNAQPGLQAAAPALETARLFRMLGVGAEVLRGFAIVLLLASALSVLVGLLSAVRERQGDLAMLRMLGAPAWRVAALVSLEAVWLALLASGLGLALGHALAEGLGLLLAEQQSLRLGGAWWSAWEWAVPGLALLLALASAAWPAWRAFRLDVTELLQSPR
ncbi:ABC transporter permease [Paucibacter sediminis]|uniref:ABC transporter permease n=1 Tax=Paucibacter sediminis TaxID=3019553 RepID=A0AA95NDV9_9BURK|nr:FtsX-like permease family protein [Paucibacter sp. S2-9]WIT11027.1 ABC transporter permease [Paucibacter sp. S2-9]